MDQIDATEAFVDRVVGVQQGLFAYILGLVPQVNDANDVLQETNLILWRKREEFRAEAAFWPWARTIAHFQVLAHLKRHSRDRLRFSEDLMSRLTEEAVAQEAPSVDVEQAALGRCIEELPPPKRELIELRYSSGLAVAEIARRIGRSPGATADALYRIRGQLAECIQDKLGAEKGTGPICAEHPEGGHQPKAGRGKLDLSPFPQDRLGGGGEQDK